MELENMTIKQFKELQTLFAGGAKEPICEVGKSYFIRSVTHHYTGKCTKVNDQWLELTDAAWIADDGRFHNFLKSGDANEVEPYIEPVRIPVGCILDITEWKLALPRTVK